MEKLETLQELPVQWVNAVGETVLLDLLYRVATDLQFIKNTVSVKCSKARHASLSTTCRYM